MQTVQSMVAMFKRTNVMNRIKDLEAAARRAHAQGEPWAAFWSQHGNEARALEPWNRARYGRLYRRLMQIVLCGDLDGMEPAGDAPAPWEADDDQAVTPINDTATQARCLWLTPKVQR